MLPSASTPTAIAVRQDVDSVTSDAPAVAARASAGPEATRPATGTSSPCGPSARLAKDRSAVWLTSSGVATTNRSTSTACRRASARARRTAREASIGSSPSGRSAPPVLARPSSHGSANSVAAHVGDRTPSPPRSVLRLVGSRSRLSLLRSAPMHRVRAAGRCVDSAVSEDMAQPAIALRSPPGDRAEDR